MIQFENYTARIEKINSFLSSNSISSLDHAQRICEEHSIDVSGIVRQVQANCFDDVIWAYIIGCAAALQQKAASGIEIANIFGNALQAFCLENSVADKRNMGVAMGNFVSMILDDNCKCFAFLAGHESFAAANSAIAIVNSANKVRKTKLRVILNGLGKDAAEIISRVNGFTYVETSFDYETETLKILDKISFSDSIEKDVLCYGANDMREGLAIMEYEDVDISISGNATNMAKFQHPVASAYKRNCNLRNKNYFACASGGGLGRTMNRDDIAAGPASYGFTDMMARMYADAMFAGSSSVPAHVEMMGFVGMGLNPMLGATIILSAEVLRTLTNNQN